VNAAAAAQGLAPGWKLADALAVLPGLKTAPAEPDAEAEALQALCDWCVRYSPAVAPDPPDGLFLEVSGMEALWGGGSLLADLIARLAAQGIPAQGAIAATPGAAWALARFTPGRPLPSGEGFPRTGARDSGRRSARGAGAALPPEIPSSSPSLRERGPSFSRGEKDEADLAPLPVAALRLDPDTDAALRRLGLKTIGQVRALPRAQLARRFGQRLLLRLDQAAGDLEEALPYRRPPAPFFERLAFVEPIAAPEDLARAAGDILEKLCAALEARGSGARRFTVTFHRVDGKPLPLTVGAALAGRDPRRLARLFAPKLETVDPGFGLEAVTAEAELVEPLAPRQAPLAVAFPGSDEPGKATDSLAGARPCRRTGDHFAGTRSDAGTAKARAMKAETGAADLVDRLKARLGEDAVWRAEVNESWVPERTVAHAQPFAPRSGRGWDPARPRPLRLFERPEPIEAIAPVPDDPPRQFRWRGRLCKVRAAEGPERIAEEWWRRPIEAVGPARVRDYYRVEDADGRRFWLFRAGLYEPGTPPRWFVHGLFE